MSIAVIHLDPMGRIRALDPAAEALLGMSAPEVVAKERVAMLVPGAVALEQLPGWLATAASEGSWEGDGLCRHRDGRPLPCHLRFTATMEEGRPTGFVQELSLLEGVDPATLAPEINPAKRFVAITRLPFVTASVLPMMLGLAVAAWAGVAFSWLAAVLVVLSVLLLHLGSNTINDWYDWKSGADAANHDYVAPFSGGSRAVPMGLISEQGLLRLSMVLFALGLGAGTAVLVVGSPWLLAVGLAGAALGFFYSVGPVRLVARRGLGELAIFLAFGPLLTLAGYAAGGAPLAWAGALVGVPAGLWTTGILWVNCIPDCPGDQAAGKWNLVATLGRRNARWGLPVLLGAGHVATVLLVVFGLLPWPVLASVLALPMVVKGSRVLWAHYDDDGVIGACAATVQHQLVAAVLTLLGVIGAGLLG
jgi:1,4-dihydroxy-2-naphthoate polyprenyltransferase